MVTGLKVAAGLCLLLDLASTVAMIYYGVNLVQHGAPNPDPATGQMVAIHNKAKLFLGLT
jgi:hypothetical protein